MAASKKVQQSQSRASRSGDKAEESISDEQAFARFATPDPILLRAPEKGEGDIDGETSSLIGDELPFSILRFDRKKGGVWVRVTIPYPLIVFNRMEGVRIGSPAACAEVRPLFQQGMALTIVKPLENSNDEVHVEFLLRQHDNFQATIESLQRGEKEVPVTVAHVLLLGIGVLDSESLAAHKRESKVKLRINPKKKSPTLHASFGISIVPVPPDADE